MSALAIETTTVTTGTAMLVEAVKHALLGVSKRPPVPLLACLVVAAESDVLAVTGFDFETRVTRHMEAAGDLPQTLVVGSALKDALTRLDQKKPVTLTVDDEHLVITQGSRTVRLKSHDMAEYPALPPVPVTPALETTGYNLAALSTGLTPSVGKDDMLPVLTGIHLKLDGDTLVGEATDRFRAAYMEKIVLSHVEEFDVLVPRLPAVAAVLGKDDAVAVSVENGIIFFDGTTGVVSVRLIDGSFPRIRALFPAEPNTISEFEPVGFLSAVKFVEAGVRKNEAIQVHVTEGKVTLSASNDEGETSDHVPAEVVGNDLHTGFNPAYLTDAVKVFGKDNPVRMSSTVAIKPVVFESDSIPTLRVLLMPRRLVS